MNKKHLMRGVAGGLMILLAGAAQSALITPVSVSGTGTYTNSPDLIADNVIPAEGSGWNQADKVWWNGTSVILTLDLGDDYLLQDMLASVDNNDSYRVDWSLDNLSWTTLFTIQSSYGEIGGGMDTMSTESGNPEYVTGIDFSAVTTRYLRIASTGGDDMYSVGELQAFGTLQNAPNPGVLSLLGLGLPLLIRRVRGRG